MMETDETYPKDLDPIKCHLKIERDVSQMSMQMIMEVKSRSSIGTAMSDGCGGRAKTTKNEEMGEKVAIEAVEGRSDEITASTTATTATTANAFVEKRENVNIEERTEPSPIPIDDSGDGTDTEENILTRISTASSSTISLVIDAFIPLTRINTAFDSKPTLQQNELDAASLAVVPEWCKNNLPWGKEEKISLPDVNGKKYLTSLAKDGDVTNRDVEVEVFDLEGGEQNIAFQKSPTYSINKIQEDNLKTGVEIERNRTAHPNAPPTKATQSKKRKPRMKSISDISDLVNREGTSLPLVKTRIANTSEPLWKDTSKTIVKSPRKEISRAASCIDVSSVENDSMKSVTIQTASPRAELLLDEKITATNEEASIAHTRRPKILKVLSERITSFPRKPITRVTSNIEETSSATMTIPLVRSRMKSPATMLKNELFLSTGAAQFKYRDLDASVVEGSHAESCVANYADPLKEFGAQENAKASDGSDQKTLQNSSKSSEKTHLRDEKLRKMKESAEEIDSESQENVESEGEKDQERRKTVIDSDEGANVPVLGEFLEAEKAWIRQLSFDTSRDSELMSMGAVSQITQKRSNKSSMAVVPKKKEEAVTFSPIRKAKSKIKSKHRKRVVTLTAGLNNNSDKKVLKVEMKKKKLKNKVLKGTPILRGKIDKKKGKSGLKMW